MMESSDRSAMSSAPEKDQVLFQQNNFSSTLLHNFQDIKHQEQLCNVSVLVGGRVFRAHRVVLAAVSPVFRAMFTNDMAEAKQEQIQFPKMDAGAFEELLQFAYSGKVRMSLDSVASLMSAASFFQMNAVVEFGTQFLQPRLQVENVLGIQQLADGLDCETLMEAADRFIDKYFVLLSKTADFHSLSWEGLTRILMKDELFVYSEVEVFEALMGWVEANPGSRVEQLASLLPCVRLPLMSDKFLSDCVSAHPLIRASPQCQELLHIAKDYKLMPSRQPLLETFQMKPRCCKDPPGLIFVIGGCCKDGHLLSSVETYDPLVGRWSSAQPLNTPRAFAAVAVMDGFLFAIGGSSDCTEPLRSVESLPFSCWGKDATLNQNRNGACAASTDTDGPLLFVCGGSDGVNSLSSVEVLKGDWTLTSPMLHRRNRAGVAVLDGKIYMMGGLDGHHLLDSVERLDPETMQWTMVRPMRTSRYLFGACSLNGRLFVCGGLDSGHRALRSVEMYDPCKNEWEDVASMNNGCFGLTLVSQCSRLYAIGGDDGSGTLSSVETFNPAEGVWRSGPSLQTARSGAGAAVFPIFCPEDIQP